MTVRIYGGDEGETVGRVAALGKHGFVGVGLRVASVATGKLRRAPVDAPRHKTERGERHVSAAAMGSAVEGREGEGNDGTTDSCSTSTSAPAEKLQGGSSLAATISALLAVHGDGEGEGSGVARRGGVVRTESCSGRLG